MLIIPYGCGVGQGVGEQRRGGAGGVDFATFTLLTKAGLSSIEVSRFFKFGKTWLI